jgi:hypothetical protein
MSFRFGSALRVLCLSAFLLCLAHLQAAEPGPFAGKYHLDNVTQDALGVHVRVTLTLSNGSKTDVKGGIVALLDSTPRQTLLGSFAPVKLLPRAGTVDVVESFTVPVAEFNRWKQGHQPAIQFLVQGEDGAVAANVKAARYLKPGEDAN